jgi:hypothetical protein
MSQPTPKKSRPPRASPVPGAPMPENLVAEIVDQITEKQARAIRHAEAESPSPAEKAWRAEETVAGTPYQTVLCCANENSETP